MYTDAPLKPEHSSSSLKLLLKVKIL